MRTVIGALLAIALSTEIAQAQSLRSMIEQFTIEDFLSDQLDAEARTIIEFAEASGKFLLDRRAWEWRSSDRRAMMWRIRTAQAILRQINEENAQHLRRQMDSARIPNSVTNRGAAPGLQAPSLQPGVPTYSRPPQYASPGYAPRDTPVQTGPPVDRQSLQELRKMYPGYGEGPANGRTGSGAGFVEGDHPARPCPPGITRQACREMRRPVPRGASDGFGGGGSLPTIVR